MARQHGITSDTYQRFLIDSGKVYINYDESDEAELGATRGGNSFTITTDNRSMPADGAPGDVKGGRRIINVAATMTINHLELTAATLARILPGSDTADYGSPKTHDQITRDLQLALTDYITNMAIVGETTVSPTGYGIFILSNVMSVGNFELTMADDDESVLSGEFAAHFDPADLTVEPWEIRWPVES